MGLLNKLMKGKNSCCCGNMEDLIVKDEKEDNRNSCSCSCGDDCNEILQDTNEKNGLTIKILGSGCKNCVTLTENVKLALEEMKLEANIVKVTDFAEITGYGIMTTPAMVVNEKVVSYGKVLKPKEVIKILENLVGE